MTHTARRRIRIASAATLGLALGCGEGEPPSAPAPEPAPVTEPATAPEAAPAPAPTPAAEPAPAVEPTAAGDAERGAPLYAMYCATCHGATGGGDGPAAAALDPRPARHDDAAYMDSLSDEHLFVVIQQGGAAVGKSPLMAAWGGTLSDDQIRDVIAFVRTLPAR